MPEPNFPEPPLLGKSEKDAKQLVIGVLSRKPGLTAKQIFKAIHDDGVYDLTYQAVHKSVVLLSEAGVLKKTGTAYALDLDWVVSLKRWGDELYANYSGKPLPSLLEMVPEQTISVSFNDPWVTPYYWLLDQCARLFKHTGQLTNGVVHCRHVWPLTVLSEKEHEQFSVLFSKGENRLLVQGNTSPDRVLAAFWERLGFTYKVGVPCAQFSENVVMQDYVVQIFHPEETHREMDRVYEKMGNASPPDLSPTHAFAFKYKTPANLVITRNASLADQIREQTRVFFRK